MGMRTLSVALAAIALGAVTVAPVSAATGNDIIEIKNAAYGVCLQAEAQSYNSPGAGACTGARGQQWEVIPVSGGKTLLRNLESGECVSQLYGSYYCDDEAPDQSAELVSDKPGTVRVKFGDWYIAGLTLADGSHTATKTYFHDGDEQRWVVRTVGTTTPPADTANQVVRIRSAESGTGCIGLMNGAWLRTAPCSDAPEQKFQRIELGDGRTALRSTVSGKCVATQQNTTLETDVLSDCAPQEARQHWTIEPTRTGAARIRQSADDRYFTPVGENVYLTTRRLHLNTWQLWELMPA
jgi:hypothetical protein